MTARTLAKFIIAALVVLLIVFASEIVLLLFAAVLLAVLLRRFPNCWQSTLASRPGGRWRSLLFCWRFRSRWWGG